MEFMRFVGMQFARPSGAAGEPAAFLMSVRNRRRYSSMERAFSGNCSGNLVRPGSRPCDCEFSLRETFQRKTGSSGLISRDCRFSIHKQFTNISLTFADQGDKLIT